MPSRSRDTMCPRVCQSSVPQKDRGRREDRVHAAPAVSCARCTKRNAHEHTGSAEAVRPSLRNGFTAYNGLSPVTGLFCHRCSREAIASQELDASVGASGPHDFAVRIGTLVSRTAASTASHPNVRDDGQRPSEGRDGGAYSSESSARGRANCPTGNAIVMHRFSSRFPVVLPRCGFWLRLDWGNPIPDKAALSTFRRLSSRRDT